MHKFMEYAELNSSYVLQVMSITTMVNDGAIMRWPSTFRGSVY